MTNAADRADTPIPSACDIVLALFRATEAGNPFAFVQEEQGYLRPLEGGAARSASFPWSDALIGRLAAIQRERADPAAAAWLGEELRAFLLGLGWDREEQRIQEALDAGRPVHVTLRFGAAELYALPWELVPLGASGRPLGSLARCLLRYEWPETATARPEPDPPPEGGRVLFAWSGAGGIVPADQHLGAIRRAARAGGHTFDERDVLPHASLGRLQQALRAAPVAVLHLLCHGGGLDADGSAYGLILDDDDGAGGERVDARALQMALADHAGSLRLVVLSACHSGAPGALDSRLGSVAQALHRAGIPAVVASRNPLSTDASCELTDALYRGLLVDARSLEESFLAARARLCERPGHAGWASLQLYARAADGPDHRPLVHRPYRGLLPFQEEHARHYFGRDAEVQEATGDLAALAGAGGAARPRFLIVTGASGTGKSSLVMAGVVPALKRRDGRWSVAVMRPHDGWRAALAEALAARPDGSAPLLLVADQLEEIFTVMTDKAAREALIGELWRLASDPGSGVSVIATLRVDFLARCSEIRLGGGDRTLEDVAYDEAHRIFIRKMKAEPMRVIIEQPARRLGLALEEGLAEQMLEEVGEEPGALPLLQYALDQLWLRREGRLLTWEHYKDLGGVGGALEKRADAILGGMDAARQRAARRLLVQLVTLDGDARLDRRRRVPLDKLRRGPAAEAAAFEEALHTLVRERLLVLSGGGGEGPAVSQRGADQAPPASRAGKGAPIVEVAHEQLIRSWETLRAWVREDRRMLAELQQLERWVEEAKGFPRYVLDSDRLGHAREMLKRYPDDIDDAARQLVARSDAAAARSRMWTRGVAVGGVAAAVVMGGLAAVALQQRDTAKKAEEAAEMQAAMTRDASLMAGARETVALGQSETAMTLLVNVEHPERVRGWVNAAYDAFLAPRATLRGHSSTVYFARYGSDGKRIVTAAHDRTVRVWNADGSGDPTPVGRVKIDNSDFPSDSPLFVKSTSFDPKKYVPAAFSPDGKRIVTTWDDGTARLWNADASGSPQVLAGHSGHVLSVAFSPDGKRVATTSEDGTVRLWSADRGVGTAVLEGHEGPVRAAAFSPDGKRVFTISNDGTARVWSVDGTPGSVVFRGDADPVFDGSFSPDGSRFLGRCNDREACMWSADRPGGRLLFKRRNSEVISTAFSPDGKRILTEETGGGITVSSADGSGAMVHVGDHGYMLSSAVFGPDGRRIVTTSAGTDARVWSTDAPGEPVILEGHEGDVLSAAFSPDGKRVVTASSDRTARVWSAGGDLYRSIHFDSAREGLLVAASPDGLRVLTVPDDGSVRVWNLDGSRGPKLLTGDDQGVTHAAFSPDGKHVIAVRNDDTARVWSADGSGKPLVLRWQGESDRDQDYRPSSALSPDGKRIVIASGGHTARLWSAESPGQPLILSGHGGPINSVVFSPDGRRVVTASDDRTARVWDADDGRPIARIEYRDPISYAALSPDGARIVAASRLNTVHVRSADGSRDIAVLSGHQDHVRTAAFSPDGKRVVSASDDRTARVWDADGSGEPVVLRAQREVVSAAFTPDGERVVTLSRDDTARVWPVSIDAISQALRREAEPCLSPRMRQIYLSEDERQAREGHARCNAAQAGH